jgi:hypothetical protein
VVDAAPSLCFQGGEAAFCGESPGNFLAGRKVVLAGETPDAITALGYDAARTMAVESGRQSLAAGVLPKDVPPPDQGQPPPPQCDASATD